MKVTVYVEVRPTEDLEKVKKALLNVFTPDELKIEEQSGKKYLVGFGYSYHCLVKLQNLIKVQGIEDSARLVFSRGIISENRIVFHLNKQAAYVGVLSFATIESESPLGPITFIIETNNVRQLIDWLSPKTLKGKRLYEVKPPEDP